VQFEEAVTYFSDYLELYPEELQAYQFRAMSLWYAGRLPEAISDFSPVLQLTPHDIPSLSGRGQILAELGDNEKALDDLNSALQSIETISGRDAALANWGKDAEAYTRNGKGLALAGLGNGSEARQEFERSISLSPENAWVYHNRAQVHERLGNRNDAVDDYRRSLEKTAPKLTPLKRIHALARLEELSRLP
jgi:tetratricopeptide (TPR) repeat protein